MFTIEIITQKGENKKATLDNFNTAFDVYENISKRTNSKVEYAEAIALLDGNNSMVHFRELCPYEVKDLGGY